MDISVEYLKNSILSVYKEFLIGLNDNIEEVYSILENHESLSEEDRINLKEELRKIDNLHKTEDLYCNTDGSTKISSPVKGEKRKVIDASCAYYVTYNNKEILRDAFQIPLYYQVDDIVQNTTIQMAEYQAILSSIRAIKSYHPNPRIINLTLYTDALIICNQLNGDMKTRSVILSDFKEKILEESSIFNNVKFIHVPRTENMIANKLCRSHININ